MSGVKVLFAHDTEVALASAAALVNTFSDGCELLPDRASFDAWLARFPFSGRHLRTNAELDEVRALRTRLRRVWQAPDRDAAVVIVNDILREAQAMPYLTRHDAYDWHLHVTEPDAPLAQRMGAEAAMAFADLIRSDELARLRICAAPDCDDVVVDLSRNRSKRYCDTGNCGNRTNVYAYRSRKKGADRPART
ncbi:CGNR zinc finger domain-containing protein [Microlunatus panaciterrae]|uniref:RNA-binding Zn ribbon-like protein n=1 Tax=Microlunatus panaciterrae TaxID=400768 RepID=A0ABS2RJ83_9ACTN|nr:CGNR zinc finger domain-containing protein [Microlunatus panaciterrae]MBM7798723.1 putative RNA-binding Zn ribbon-like protein [Microlunatus panaciterrae]